jgi:hypothetical protein
MLLDGQGRNRPAFEVLAFRSGHPARLYQGLSLDESGRHIA